MQLSCPSASKSPHHPDIHFANTRTVHTTIRALTRLNISNNKAASKEAGKALATALAINSSLKELDVSRNTWIEHAETPFATSAGDGPGFAQELAVGLTANEALRSLNISNNSLGGHQGEYGSWISDMIGTKALAAAIPACK